MSLPPELANFATLSFWSPLFLLIAVGLALYAGWCFWRERHRSDLYYALLGVYLFGVQLPSAVPAVGQAIGYTCPLSGGITNRLLLAAPVVVLFILAGREGDSREQRPS
ncbi:MAG TPA: hypothetical protein VF960_04775 [Chloroflexota bacterium]